MKCVSRLPWGFLWCCPIYDDFKCFNKEDGFYVTFVYSQLILTLCLHMSQKLDLHPKVDLPGAVLLFCNYKTFIIFGLSKNIFFLFPWTIYISYRCIYDVLIQRKCINYKYRKRNIQYVAFAKCNFLICTVQNKLKVMTFYSNGSVYNIAVAEWYRQALN